MKTALKRLKNFAVTVILLELILIIFVGICYYKNFFDIRSLISLEVVFIVLCGIILLDLVFLWISILVFMRLKRKTDLKAAELIGADIQEAYNFGNIGLVVVDESNTVLWVNDLFVDRKIDILNENILKWQPDLQDLADGVTQTTIKITLNARNYEVKLLRGAGLYIFKDVTEIESLSDFSKRHATVVGQLMIDNFSDIADAADELNDIINKVRNAIFAYAEEFKVTIKRIRNDAYFLLCNHESLQKMEEDRFSILEKVRKIGMKEDVPPTLSIGIAHDFPDISKLDDMAQSAIEIAMSRGGDQCVVSQYGHDLLFFGGKTLAVENRNKVKVRTMADSVVSLIKNSSNVIILGHKGLDMDALGACFGVKAICDYCEKPSCIIYDPKMTERKTKFAVTSTFTKDEIQSYLVSESNAINLVKANTLIVVVDVHNADMTMSPKIIEKATKVMIIDHHRRGEKFIDSPVFAYIDPSASSTSEIISEFVRYSAVNPRIMIPEKYATLMLAGIFMDSNFYKNTMVGMSTFEASMILKEYGADNQKADEFLKDEYEEYALITRIVSTMKTPYYGIVYCLADEEDIIEPAALAKAANQCMQMKGINACFVIGRCGIDETRISCRSDGSVNVQLLAEKLNGGGHYTMAACSFKKMTIGQVETRLLNVLSEELNNARSDVERN